MGTHTHHLKSEIGGDVNVRSRAMPGFGWRWSICGSPAIADGGTERHAMVQQRLHPSEMRSRPQTCGRFPEDWGVARDCGWPAFQYAL